MILLLLALFGGFTAIVTSVFISSNGLAILGLLLTLPAAARGMTHDFFIYLPRKRQTMTDFDQAYDRTDPKHPDYIETLEARAEVTSNV